MKSKDFIKVNLCRLCGKESLSLILDFGEHPLANSLLDKPGQKEKYYPLSLHRCNNCSLVQLGETISPKVLFQNYVWVTGTSRQATKFAPIFKNELLKRTENAKKGYVLELASNDGTFLKPFIEDGFTVLGIDPAANIVKIAQENGIPTKCVFWGMKEARTLTKEKGQARIIFARNVLPHVANTEEFIEGIHTCLTDNGIVAIEVHYAKVILDGLHYDSIYHEHLYYFTLKSLEVLLNKWHLFIFDIAESPISGGSIIIYAKKKQSKESKTLRLYRRKEKTEKVNTLERWEEFKKQSKAHRDKLITILKEEKIKGKSVVGWGASARSSTMLNFCETISKDAESRSYRLKELIQEIADMNHLKHGKYTAGTHIPIQSPDKVLKKRPQSVIILAWNFTDEIKETLKHMFHFKGKVIIPLPQNPRIEKI